MDRELERGSLTLFVFAMITNIVNYAFQILSARILSVQDFGLLTVLLSAVLIFSAPANALRMVASKYVAETKHHEGSSALRALTTQLIGYTGMMALVFFIAAAALSVVLDHVMSIHNLWITNFIFLVIALSYYQYTAAGISQGLQRFALMSMIGLVVAVVKVLGAGISALPIAEHLRFPIILSSLLVGTLACIILGYVRLGKAEPVLHALKIQRVRREERIFSFKFTLTALILNVCLTFMMNIDVLLVRYFSPAYQAGIYSSATQFGKILIYAVTSLVSALYPIVAKKRQEGNTLSIYFKTLLYTALTTAVFLLPILLFPRTFVLLLFSAKYLEALPYIQYSCLLAVMVVLNTLNMNYMMATDNVKILTPTFIIGSLLCVAVGALFSASIYHMLLALSAVMLAIYLVSSISLFPRMLKKVSVSKDDPT